MVVGIRNPEPGSKKDQRGQGLLYLIQNAVNFNLQGQILHENLEDGKAMLHLGSSCSLKHTSWKMAVHPLGL